MSSLEMLQPDDGDGYLIVARELLQGVEALLKLAGIPPRACALIAAHSLECILKAYLWHKGKKAELKGWDIGHNILKLWDLAYSAQLPGISETPPDWVRILSEGHGPNYYFRYPEGENKTVVHGGPTPALEPMVFELSSLFKQVELAVKAVPHISQEKRI
ncbi:hypothetical protein [Porticoccus sp.]